MDVDNSSDLRPLTTRLRQLHGLLENDRAALARLPLRTEMVAAGRSIVWPGQPADRCVVVLKGMTFGYKLTGGGGRQIVGLHLAGDLPDLQGLRFGTTDTGVAAINGCHVGYIPSGALNDLCSSRPSLASVLWRETLLQAAIVREWVLNIGRRDAQTSLGHFLCEVVMRHRIAGLTSIDGCKFPFTQSMMADALGLSAVHVNRVLKDLRRDGLIEWAGRHLTVLDWERLMRVSDFDPSYLHLDRSLSVA